VYPRSCLKPLQAAAMLALGLDLPDEQLAVACASHDGTRRHLDVVLAILHAHGLGEDDLQNTPSTPYGDPCAASSSSLAQNCSGKHAAMLATCVVNGWPTAAYLELDHPLQRAITAWIEEQGWGVAHVGVDGCGAPTHVMALVDLAQAYVVLAAPGSPVARAMTSHPVLVGGVERDVSIWMAAVPGLIAKEGAAGVMAVGLPDGRAAAFKVADGSDAARRAVTVAALRALGVDVDEATPAQVRVPVLGHGREVGSVEPVEWGGRWSS
jgi:L-asparaginase II